MQTTSKVLMVRPFIFAYNDQTAGNNHFQQESDDPDIATKAAAEFDALADILLRNDVDVIVVQDTPEPWTPDSIFPNNWFSSHLTGQLVLYPMFAPNRRTERKSEVLRVLRREMGHTKIVDLTHWEAEQEFLEGTGSMVFDRDKNTAYCCRSPRTSEKVVHDFCAKMNFDAVMFDGVDLNNNPLYHTNIMMSIGMQVAIICLQAIKDEVQRQKVVARLQASGKVIVDISPDQMNQFAGNMLELKNRNGNPLMVMSSTARKSLTFQQENIIGTYTRILSSDLSTIEQVGGGSARCMIAEIFA
ncbi:MAG: arginine deiminase-related protein [Dysgonamonadaceae bacterium]